MSKPMNKNKPRRTITAALLRFHHACEPQVELFEYHFPDGAEVNVANALKAKKAGLNIGWAAENLLTACGYLRFHDIREAANLDCSRETKRASDAYVKALSAIGSPNRTVPDGYDEDEERDEIEREYHSAHNRAWDRFDHRVCLAFVTTWNAQEREAARKADEEESSDGAS